LGCQGECGQQQPNRDTAPRGAGELKKGEGEILSKQKNPHNATSFKTPPSFRMKPKGNLNAF